MNNPNITNFNNNPIINTNQSHNNLSSFYNNKIHFGIPACNQLGIVNQNAPNSV